MLDYSCSENGVSGISDLRKEMECWKGLSLTGVKRKCYLTVGMCHEQER